MTTVTTTKEIKEITDQIYFENKYMEESLPESFSEVKDHIGYLTDIHSDEPSNHLVHEVQRRMDRVVSFGPGW